MALRGLLVLVCLTLVLRTELQPAGLNALRGPDRLVLRVLVDSTEKLKALLRRDAVNATGCPEFQWLNLCKEDLCKSFGISPSPDIFICEHPGMLAQAVQVGEGGRLWFSRAVLETLSKDEVRAVMAHELGHLVAGHQQKRGFLILDWYRLMLLRGLFQGDKDGEWDDLDVESGLSLLGLWLVLGLRSRAFELEADRFMLRAVDPATALRALARMHCPTEGSPAVLRQARRRAKRCGLLRVQMLLTGASHPCLPLRVQALERLNPTPPSCSWP